VALRDSGLARSRQLRIGAAAGVAVAAGGLWYRRYTTPFPYTQRWMLDKELPYLTRERVCSLLAPQPGEAVLEIGPGTGLFSLPVAQRLLPTGRLAIFDVQQVMLEHTLRRGAEHGLQNIDATRGDATKLPFADHSFDAAFIITALGEISDQNTALSELARVLKPGGRLVVGEFLIDCHAVRLGALRPRAGRHGFRIAHTLGPRHAYLARLHRS